MPKSVVEHFSLNQSKFDATGAFDAMVDWDTLLFVDPFLLKSSGTPEFKGSHEELLDYFSKTLKLIGASKSKNDLAWKEAHKRLVFREPGGFGLGYTKESVKGSGVGPALADSLIANLQEIEKQGIQDPELFELLGLFQDKVGCDLIGDMTCNILLTRFAQFTARVFLETEYQGPSIDWNIRGKKFSIPVHPSNPKSPIFLTPTELLSDLPVAEDFDDIDTVCSRNSQLRTGLNTVIGSHWRGEAEKHGKAFFRNLFLKKPELLKEIIKQYKEADPRRYDFDRDPSGEISWRYWAKKITSDFPLELSLQEEPSFPEVYGVVETICTQFSKNIEQNGLWEALWDDQKKRHRKERIAQKLFFAVAESYCEANNLDISPESNAGRGPVDFKFSRGLEKVVVEVKLSDSSSLKKNYENQVEIYRKSEKALKGYYLVIQVDNNEEKIKSLYEVKNSMTEKGQQAPEIIIVDATPKKSASNV